MRVLIVEDDLTSRAILAAAIRGWGWEPVVTEDGNAAWEVLQGGNAPRLVLLDWSMPGMDGLEVCRRLRQLDIPDPPYVILLTARGKALDIVEGLEAGANDYVAKPYDNAELRARIGVGQRMLALQADLVEANIVLEHEATHDPLTGVLNRRAILEALHRELSRARRENGTLTVGLCDIDHFKSVNDTYGHQVGDEVIVACTQRLCAGLRDYDWLGRYGGEEFLVIAAHPQEEPPESIYERLCACIAGRAIETGAGAVTITVSAGVTTATGNEKADALIAVADAALYKAKASGRNRVAFCEPPGRKAEAA